MPTKTKTKSAQEFISIQEIRDGVVIMKDNSLKMVLMASSLNFALKSADEQEAIIMQFQNFLNALDFSVQFVVHSRKLNINPYLETLRETEKKQVNELLKIQTREYVEFVKNFVENSNIVSKAFYIIVPFDPPALEIAKGLLGAFIAQFSSKKNATERLSDEKFEEYKTQIWQRVETVTQGLVRTGVRLAPLNTEELIELYYGLFNPGELEKGHAPGLN